MVGRKVVAVVAALLFCVGALGAVECAAVVFPDASIPQNGRSGIQRDHGLKRALMMVIHDVDEPYSTSEWSSRVDELRDKELATREFFAENSGGAFDIYYEDIIDVPIQLNSDGTRPDNFWNVAQGVARSTYGKDLNDYYMFAYDIRDTKQKSGQGWGGLSTGDRIYLRGSFSQKLIDHEIGHQVGADHAKSFNIRRNDFYRPYVWDEDSETYTLYNPRPGQAQNVTLPYGVTRVQYGNPFDTMGNKSHGHFRVREKLEDLEWLTDQQVPRVDGAGGIGPGQYKIYAHDELQAVINNDGEYGVLEGYDSDALYGLTYRRPGWVYSVGDSRWVPENQTIDIEYRSGMQGALVYLQGTLLNIAEGESWLLDTGHSIEDPDFGLSRFSVETGSIGQEPTEVDFLSFNPPPPPELPDDWFRISVTGSGVDELGSYIFIDISVADGSVALEGDFNLDGIVDSLDYAVWREGLDTTYTQADFLAWRNNYGAQQPDGRPRPGTAPEPAALALLLMAATALSQRSRA